MVYFSVIFCCYDIMKFLSKENFKLLINVLQKYKQLTSKDQGVLYHIMVFINNKKNTSIFEKNKLVLHLFQIQNKNNPLENLLLTNDITKAYFVPINEQRNTRDIQIDNTTSTIEFKKIYQDSLTFMSKIHKEPIENYNSDILIPETSEIQQLRKELYMSIMDTVYLHIDSRDRQFSEHLYDMHIDLDRPIKQIYSIELINAEIPKNQYIIHSHNNTLHFQETPGITLQLTISIGNYTISELITELETQLNNTGSSNYTVSLINERVRIASDLTGGGNIFSLLFNGGTEKYGFKTRSIYKTNSIGDIIGFPIQDFINASHYIASEKYKLDGENGVYLHFANIDCQKRYDQGAFGFIPLDTEHGNIVYFNGVSIKQSFSPFIDIDHLRVQLKTYYNYFYQCGEWSFLLKINFLKK